jgi:hypothetical protein
MTTIGEYIKTKAAHAEADSKFRKYLNSQIKDGYKLIKYKKGTRGTLDYGKSVLMFTRESALKDINPKVKPYIFIMRWNFGVVRGSNPYEFKMFKLKSVAEKQYATWVRMMD